MGCSYTGSAGGAIVIDTPNCANKLAGTANIRTANNRKREVRILNHLARSSFDCPVEPCCCGLRGLRAMDVDRRIPRIRLLSLCNTTHFGKHSGRKVARAQRKWTRADDRSSLIATVCLLWRYSVTLMARLTPGY